RYLVGCDGAHSTVRKNAGFSFAGGTYPQDFVLGDVEADGPLAGGAINAFTGAGGVAMFFPLGTPRTWRVIAMRTATGRQRSREEQPPDAPSAAPLTLEELQEIVAPPTSGTVTVRDPAWLTHFHLHHRQVEHYRRGRVFLAGDAAHIHSPVGAQGMNTGIQDAWNLGWKLALASRSPAPERLLDSYEAERWPVGRFLLRYTDRLFATFTRVISGGPVATWAREVVVPRVVPRVIGGGWLRTAAFRFVSELAIRYRKSPAVREGEPRLRRGPRAGDRLPDARLTIDGAETFLQRAAVAPRFTVLLCGRLQPPEDVIAETRRVAERYGRLIDVRVLSTRGGPGSLVDTDGTVLALLGVDDAAQYLIRPDGYVAFRCGGWELRALTQFVDECLVRADGGPFRQRTGF
ncbi:MAG TPA: FAD-dependent monooxygenase, partial [Gemmatimonadaceae bacterium]|nr:FAD-dependent monooxygenase [Gemmatimonadaceae bacterium]